jgi:methionyl-tRNA formyltransferase
MTPVRVLFAGTPDVAVPSLERLVDDPRFAVVAVLTNPDRPRGRSGAPVPSPVALRALERGLPVLRPERVRDAAADIAATGADIGAVVAYGSILPTAVLEALPHGFVNLHFSLLPRWRGAAPVQHAIRAGDALMGVTAFRLDEGMDTGPVLRRLEVRPPDDVDAGELLDALAVEGAPVLADALAAVAAGERGSEQPVEGVTLAPRIRPDDAEVVWTETAVEVARRIRSVTPRPGATTSCGGERMKLAGARVVDAPERPLEPARPGEVLGTDGDAVVVACGAGAVAIARLQPAGRAWTSAADQVRGRRLTVGTVLGPEVSRS